MSESKGIHMSDKCKHCNQCVDGKHDFCACCGKCQKCDAVKPAMAPAVNPPTWVPVPYPVPMNWPPPVVIQPQPHTWPWGEIICGNGNAAANGAGTLGQCFVTETVGCALTAREIGASDFTVRN